MLKVHLDTQAFDTNITNIVHTISIIQINKGRNESIWMRLNAISGDSIKSHYGHNKCIIFIGRRYSNRSLFLFYMETDENRYRTKRRLRNAVLDNVND